jgi:polysaccharide biosynthesis protein PslH
VHILWLKTELLHPVDKGGRIRTYQMLRALKREHRITYLALDDGDAAPDAVERATEYCDVLVRVPFRTAPKRSARFWGELLGNAVSRLPYAVAKYRSPAMTREIERLVRDAGVDVVVCDFLAPSLNVPVDLPVPTVIFQHNVEAAIWRRHADVAVNPLKKTYMREQFRRMRSFEAAECLRFDHVVAVSEADRLTFERDYGVTSCSAVPTGVDTAYFHPTGNATRRPHELVFTGSMDWLPNEDAVQWFATEILPLVRQRVPDATLAVVGRNPSPAVRAVADRHAGVEVTGGVPDVRPYIERAALFIVPIRIGGGTRLKIYEAMAMESPVVSTTVGAEGLPVTDEQHVLFADEPAAFAAAIIRLLTMPDEARALGLRGADLVRREFGWARVAAIFAESCAAAIESGANDKRRKALTG